MKLLCVGAIVLLAATLPSSLQAALTVEDFEGREVVLRAPAQRIVALAPHLVENLFSAGAGGRLVGVVSSSDFPAPALKVTRVGDFQNWSLETIVALQPDLVLLWSSGNGVESAATLERLGIPVFISELRTLEDIGRAIRAYGTLAGTAAIADAEAARFDAEVAALRETNAEKSILQVFYQVWNKPLQTLNGEHFISRVIELCGGRNAFGDAPFLAPKINIESVLQRDPDVIIASGMSDARPGWLDDWLRWPQLSAVRNQQLYGVNPDHIQRPTVRSLEGARVICNQLDRARNTAER